MQAATIGPGRWRIARWRGEGIRHADMFAHHRAVKDGDQIGTWVDSDGRRVSPPPAPAAAAMEAVCVWASVWLERDIRSLAHHDGRRANTQW